MSESEEIKREASRPRGRQRPESLLFPLLLIAAGAAFLAQNMGLLEKLNWGAVLSMWPLLLIFIGLDILVRQFGRPIGTLLSGLLAIIAVGIFGLILLRGGQMGLPGSSAAELKRESIAYSADGVRSAEVQLDLPSWGADVYALEDSPNLIEGEVVYVDRLDFETRTTQGAATIILSESRGSAFFNPLTWLSWTGGERWQLGLNPAVPMALTVDVGSGSAELDLRRLALAELKVDGGSGSVELLIPVEAPDIQYEGSSGSARLRLPESGRHQLEADTGSGSVRIIIPAGMEVRVHLESKGSGTVTFDASLRQVEGRGGDEGVWETAGYGDAANQTEITLNTGSGSVRVERG